MQQIHIKNMVCPRCIETVRGIFSEMGYQPHSVGLGVVTLPKQPELTDTDLLDKRLKEHGFELATDKASRIVSQTKSALINYLAYIEDTDSSGKLKLSEFLSTQLGNSYSQLSKYFSQGTGSTIERFWLTLKIERVKELISYDELNLSEIAYRLDYSSVQHLSNQFKQHTGQTPSQYRKNALNRRQSLDQL